MVEVLPAVRRLRNDVFGNYVVQKLFEFGTSEMKAQLRDTLKGEMLPLALQMYGYVRPSDPIPLSRLPFLTNLHRSIVLITSLSFRLQLSCGSEGA